MLYSYKKLVISRIFEKFLYLNIRKRKKVNKLQSKKIINRIPINIKMKT